MDLPDIDLPAWVTAECRDFLHGFRNDLSDLADRFEASGEWPPARFWPFFTKDLHLSLGALRSLQLKTIWEQAPNKYSGGSIPHEESSKLHRNANPDIEDGQTWLFCAIYSSIPGDVVSAQEEREWKKKALRQIADLYETLASPPHTYPSRHFGIYNHLYPKVDQWADWLVEASQNYLDLEEGQRINGLGKDWIYRHGQNLLISLDLHDPEAWLAPLAKEIQDYQPGHFWGNRRSGENAERTYFVRALTHNFLCRSGSSKRDQVTAITNALYQGDITRKQVIDLTRDIVESPQHYHQHFMHGSLYYIARWKLKDDAV